MEEKEIYIHIGMPRTATTFFQQKVFPFLPEFETVGLDQSHYSESFNKLQFSDDSLYDPSEILKQKEKWKKNKILISNENFIGQSTHFNHINRSIIANRLKEAFPEAKILLVLRNQIDLLASIYAINLHWKETRKIDDIIWNPFHNKKTKTIGGPATSYYNTLEAFESLNGYNYTPLIDLYKSLFKDVKVLLFEDLIQQPDIFSEQLASFFKVDKSFISKQIEEQPKINAGVTKKQTNKLISLNRYSIFFENNRFISRICNKLRRAILQSKKPGQKPSFSIEKTKKLKSHFREINLVLKAKYPEIGIQKHSAKYYID